MKKRAIKKEFSILLKKLMPVVLAKLIRNELKYKFGNTWKVPDWKEKCQRGLRVHADKGDPIDVIIYGIFCWYHKWPTGPLERPYVGPAAPAYHPGQLVNVEVYGIDAEPLGKHTAVIINRRHVPNFGWFYGVRFLNKSGEDNPAFAMCFDYMEKRVSLLTDDDLDVVAFAQTWNT